MFFVIRRVTNKKKCKCVRVETILILFIVSQCLNRLLNMQYLSSPIFNAYPPMAIGSAIVSANHLYKPLLLLQLHLPPPTYNNNNNITNTRISFYLHSDALAETTYTLREGSDDQRIPCHRGHLKVQRGPLNYQLPPWLQASVVIETSTEVVLVVVVTLVKKALTLAFRSS